MQKSVDDFLKKRFGTTDVPEDLDALLKAIAKHQDYLDSEQNPLVQFGAELLWAEQTYPLLDHTYLNDADRTNLHTMANVRAMQDTASKLRFFLQKSDTSLLGYWQPDKSVPLCECDLFWLDTEGQYQIAEGKNVSQTLAYHALVELGPEKHEAVSGAFASLGIDIRQVTEDEIFATLDERSSPRSESPQEYREKRYELFKPPVKETDEPVERPQAKTSQSGFFRKLLRIWRGKD